MIFLAFEGVDGSGKSTLSKELSRYLSQRDIKNTLTREPGGTPFGEKIREILLQKETSLSIESELFLYQACRSQHVQKVIKPTIKKGEWVLSDRFWASTYAFQAGGRGIDEEKVLKTSLWSTGNLQPHLWILLDLPLEEARNRFAQRSLPLDCFELEDTSFHERVRKFYLKISQSNQYGPWLILDATLSVDILLKQLISELEKRKWLSK